ncbi:MAG: tryptophan--tRNA ligase, partial [Cyanobacteria bacterium P01_A01_bin.70]
IKLPEPMIQKAGARVMSLTDGTKKMSKSDPSEMSRIDLVDPPEVILRKIKRCKSDPTRGLEFDNPDRPECHNLLTLYMLLSGQTKEAVAQECAEMGWGQFKPLLAETMVEALKPIQDQFHSLMDDRTYLESILKQGREKAEAIALTTLGKAKAALGYSQPL